MKVVRKITSPSLGSGDPLDLSDQFASVEGR